MKPGSSVASPRSRTRAPAGTAASGPTPVMRPPSTTTSPGDCRRPSTPSNRCAASSTSAGGGAGGASWAEAAAASVVKTAAVSVSRRRRMRSLPGFAGSVSEIPRGVTVACNLPPRARIPADAPPETTMAEPVPMKAAAHYLRVDLADPAEAEYWLVVLDVPRARLEDAVRAVGRDALDVQAFLRGGEPRQRA